MFRSGIRSIDELEPALQALFDRRFENGDRVVVPVLGSGVNLQAAYEVGASALDWEQLLAEIEAREGITWERAPPRSMTARWEALTQRQSEERASEREDGLIASVVEALAEQTDRIWEAADREPPPLYADLLAAKFRDLISLNFDDRIIRASGAASLFRAVSPAEQKIRGGASFSVLQQLYQRYHLGDPSRFARVWYPHGRAASRATIVLGVGRYGRLVPDLDVGWRRYKAAERKYAQGKGRDLELFPEPQPRRMWSRTQIDRWTEHRRGVGPVLAKGKLARRKSYRYPQEALSWLDVFLMSPLVFIGCSLGDDEFPLWWALHQRARNQARQAPELRKPVVLLTAAPENALDHLRGGPAGLCTVVFPSWDRLWAWVRRL